MSYKIWDQLDGGAELNFYGSPSPEFQAWALTAQIGDNFGGWVCTHRKTGWGCTLHNITVARDGLRFSWVYPEEKYTNEIPDARLILGYEWMRSNASTRGIKRALDVVSNIFDISEYHISRLDVTVTINMAFEELYNNINHIDCKARSNFNIKGTHCTKSKSGVFIPESVYMGNNEIQGVIYDKSRELQVQGTEHKIVDIINYFGTTENLSRIEWRLRRRWLKRYGLNTIDDIEANWAALVEKLVNWLRFVDCPEKQKARQKVLDFWKAISRALYSHLRTEHNKQTKKLVRVNVPLSSKYQRKIKTALSLISTALAFKDLTFEESLRLCNRIIYRFYPYYKKRFEIKKQQFRIQTLI